jgi:hypothetical protein
MLCFRSLLPSDVRIVTASEYKIVFVVYVVCPPFTIGFIRSRVPPLPPQEVWLKDCPRRSVSAAIGYSRDLGLSQPVSGVCPIRLSNPDWEREQHETCHP